MMNDWAPPERPVEARVGAISYGDLILQAGLATSKTDARRLFEQGAVKRIWVQDVEGREVVEEIETITSFDQVCLLGDGQEALLRVGHRGAANGYMRFKVGPEGPSTRIAGFQ